MSQQHRWGKAGCFPLSLCKGEGSGQGAPAAPTNARLFPSQAVAMMCRAGTAGPAPLRHRGWFENEARLAAVTTNGLGVGRGRRGGIAFRGEKKKKKFCHSLLPWVVRRVPFAVSLTAGQEGVTGVVPGPGSALPIFWKMQLTPVVLCFVFALFSPHPFPAVCHDLCYVSLSRDPVRGGP